MFFGGVLIWAARKKHQRFAKLKKFILTPDPSPPRRGEKHVRRRLRIFCLGFNQRQIKTRPIFFTGEAAPGIVN